jgi:class 3 adenylate cyclase
VGEDLVRSVEPVGFRVHEVGEFELKGIARPVTLYEAVRDRAGGSRMGSRPRPGAP